MSFWLALGFAAALSLDGLAVGVAYGAKGLRVPLESLSAIGAASGVAVAVAMLVGHHLGHSVPALAAKVVGATALALIGGLRLRQAHGARKGAGARATDGGPKVSAAPSASPAPLEARVVAAFRLPVVGLVVHILREPELADVDSSGTIGFVEALLLGAALAVDAVTAGVAAGLAGMPVATVSIACLCMGPLVLWLGLVLGSACKGVLGRLDYLPGFTLVGLGLLRIVK